MQLADRESTIMTDEWKSYIVIGRDFSRGHHFVKHSDGEFTKCNIFTNAVESYFALLKRVVLGIFIKFPSNIRIDTAPNSHFAGIIEKLVTGSVFLLL